MAEACDQEKASETILCGSVQAQGCPAAELSIV